MNKRDYLLEKELTGSSNRLTLAGGIADVSSQGSSSNGPGTAKMGFPSPADLALNTGASYPAAYRR
jgi:hypothetical protein